MAAQPGSDMPNASASEFIVDAVPIVLQCPADGADEATNSMNSSPLISPAARSSRAFQTIVPEPVRSPRNQPFSIGPPERTIAGISTGAAAISRPRGVLWQH